MNSSPFTNVFVNLYDFCGGVADIEPPEVRLVFKDRTHRAKFKWAVKRELQPGMSGYWDFEDSNNFRMMDIPIRFQLQADGDPLAEITRLLEENRRLKGIIATASKELSLMNAKVDIALSRVSP